MQNFHDHCPTLAQSGMEKGLITKGVFLQREFLESLNLYKMVVCYFHALGAL